MNRVRKYEEGHADDITQVSLLFLWEEIEQVFMSS